MSCGHPNVKHAYATVLIIFHPSTLYISLIENEISIFEDKLCRFDHKIFAKTLCDEDSLCSIQILSACNPNSCGMLLSDLLHHANKVDNVQRVVLEFYDESLSVKNA